MARIDIAGVGIEHEPLGESSAHHRVITPAGLPTRGRDDGLPMPRRIRAIISVSAGSVLYTLDANIANVALPTIAHALHVSSSTAVMLVAGYNLVLAMVLLPLAAIADRVGQRRVFTLGLLCYLVSAIACYSAGSFALLLAGRAIQALAAAAVLSVSLAMVRNIYPAAVLGRGLGLNTIAASSGAAIAPVLGGLIISIASWHWVFAAGAPLALLALAFNRSLPDSERRNEPYDTLGAVLCAATFGLFIFGFQALSGKFPSGLAGMCIAAAVVTAILFVRHELKAPLPVLPVDLLAQPALALSLGAAVLTVLAQTSLMLYIPFRLTAEGLGSATIGAMIAPYAVMIMIAAPTSGMLSDRISPNVLGTVGLAIALVGILCFVRIPHVPAYRDIFWRIALCGAGFSMFFSPNGRLIIGSVPRHRAAGASSLTSTTRMFGQSLGSTLLGAMLALRMGGAAPAFASAGFAALALLCSAIRMVVGRRSNRQCLVDRFRRMVPSGKGRNPPLLNLSGDSFVANYPLVGLDDSPHARGVRDVANQIVNTETARPIAKAPSTSGWGPLRHEKKTPSATNPKKMPNVR